MQQIDGLWVEGCLSGRWNQCSEPSEYCSARNARGDMEGNSCISVQVSDMSTKLGMLILALDL